MPSRLFASGFQERLQQRQLASQFLERRGQHSTKGPWRGLAGDLSHHLVDFSFAHNVKGLVARPDPAGFGEVLAHDDGFEQIDSARLPLGNHANTSRVAVRMDNFPLTRTDGTPDTGTNQSTTPIVLIAGNGAAVGSFEMFGLMPAIGQWAEILYSTAGGSPVGENPIAGRDGDTDQPSMPDTCSFMAGAAGRAAYSGAIAQPAFLWTNNVDPVMVYPRTTATISFEVLTDQFGADFRCKSLETFGDRVYFFNTFESGVRYSRRLRRTQRGTCDPVVAAGAGSINLDHFRGNGQRVETLGDLLVCYLTDGVAFIRETGNSATPNEVQPLDTRRGLLGTHAAVSVGDNRHFGIFTDGWWLLDSNGRWEQAGLKDFSGIRVEAWKQRFYGSLDYSNLQRIQVSYDQPKNWVRIAFPVVGVNDVNTVWIYDLDGDRVWPDTYPVTCWGEFSTVTTPGVTIDALGAGPIDALAGTIDSYGPRFSSTRTTHGNYGGYVMAHSEALVTRDGANPSFEYESISSDFGNPSTLKTVTRLRVEHVNKGNNSPITLTAINLRGGEESGTVSLNQTALGRIELAERHFRVSGEHAGYRLSGTGPVAIRSITMDYTLVDEERRES